MKVVYLYYIISFLCLPFFLNGQQAPTMGPELITQLETSIRSGHKKSLRDLGSLLDKPLIKDKVQDILQRYTMFTTEEFNFNQTISKKEFLKFYYEQEDLFQFSELTGNFYLSSLEKRKVKTKIETIKQVSADTKLAQFHKIESAVANALDIGDNVSLIKQIRALEKTNSPESKQYTLELSNKLLTSSKKEWPNTVYQALNKALITSGDIESLETVLTLLRKNHIEPVAAVSSLAMISNIEIPKQTPKAEILKQYKYYIDSIGSIDNIRMYGYEQLFTFQPSFFNNIADYFGRVICFADDRDWLVHNTINDLLRTTHPRALFYIAAIGFKNEYHYPRAPFRLKEAVELIKKNTQINVGVENKKGQIIVLDQTTTDREAALNFLTYWANNHDDYEWDASRDMFVNKHQALEKTQHYERLFRRLNSRNDSVAMASFEQLTQGDPSEIVSLANKYRQMFRSYNQTLPPFKYKYLEQLAELTLFCRRYNISYQTNNKLNNLLEKLNNSREHAKRYQVENTIIKSISVDDITPLEYWACLHQENKENNFSIGRILDIYYSTHWKKILSDDMQLRLYLKKAELLKKIGVIGVCNVYLNKFELNDPYVKERLQEIRKEETDKQVINQVAQLVQYTETEEANAVSDFLANPLYFDKRDIKILPAPTLKELEEITKNILSEEENNAIKKLFFYLRLHPTLESVPNLFKLAFDERVIAKKRGKTLTIGDNVTPILESVFNYSFPEEKEDKVFDIRPWIAKWEKDKANYKKWPKQFFEEKMKYLEDEEELTIDDINLITESPNYDSTYKAFCLRVLKKVKPVKDIRSLNIEPKLSIADDLPEFEAFEFKYKELDDIPKLFELDQPDVMVNYLIKKAGVFDTEAKGSFYNNMFRHAWFSTYINSGNADLIAVAYIQQVLETYLNDSDYLSEYEEQVTTLHIAQLQSIGKPLEERLLAPFDLNADVAAIAKIQETIISTVTYEEIGIVAKHFKDLTNTLGPEPWGFLQRDFGIPVFDLTDDEAYISFRRNLNNMTEYELYFHYLKEFGLDFLTKKGKLDYEKIAHILRFDSVSPFVGGGGGKRDLHTYGIIKLLELEFETSLGFHKKLNENQSFYTFSTSKRSKAWIAFLLKKGLIRLPVNQAPSFNQILE